MNYFDMILAKNLGGGGGGGGGSLEPFRGLVFDGQITTTMGNVHYESVGDFYLPLGIAIDIEIDGVLYQNVPCLFDPETTLASSLPYFAYGADYDEHGALDYSTYPFRFEQDGSKDPKFITQTGGTYTVKVTTVINLTTAKVTFVNETGDDAWVVSSYWGDYYVCPIPANSTEELYIPLFGDTSLQLFEISTQGSFDVSITGPASWDADYYSLWVFGPATVTISSE